MPIIHKWKRATRNSKHPLPYDKSNSIIQTHRITEKHPYKNNKYEENKYTNKKLKIHKEKNKNVCTYMMFLAVQRMLYL